MTHDPVNHPAHYTQHPSGVECIEITEHMSFNVGNAVKYLWRAGNKGPTIEDLHKAAWYVNREIGRLRPLDAAPTLPGLEQPPAREAIVVCLACQQNIIMDDRHPEGPCPACGCNLLEQGIQPGEHFKPRFACLHLSAFDDPLDCPACPVCGNSDRLVRYQGTP